MPMDKGCHHVAHAGGSAGTVAAALGVLRPFCGDHPAQGDQARTSGWLNVFLNAGVTDEGCT